MLEIGTTVYPIEREQLLLAEQYLISNASTAWNLYYVQHPEGDHTWAAMMDLLYSWVAPTKHRLNIVIKELRSA
jgi:hypothetical protein